MNINKFLVVISLVVSANVYAAQASHLQAVIVPKDYTLLGKANNERISKFFSGTSSSAGSILKGSIYGLGALGAFMQFKHYGPKVWHELTYFGVRRVTSGVNLAPALQSAGLLACFVTALARLNR